MSDFYDGHPGQAGLDEHWLGGKYPDFSIGGFREMVVVDRKFSDEEGNSSRSYVEYTVRDLYTPEQISGVRRLQSMMGVIDGDEDVLHPASKLLAGKTGKLSPFTPAKDTDGDRVIVGFVEGARPRAFILGVIARRGQQYGAKKTDGERRFTTHKGTSIEIKQDGSYVVTRKDANGTAQATVTVKADGDIEVVAPDSRKFKLIYAGTDAIEIGKDPAQHAVHGEDVRSDFNALVAAFNSLKNEFYTHIHQDATTMPTTPPLDQTVIPNPPINPAGPPPFLPGVPAVPKPDNPSMPADRVSSVVKVR